MADQFPFHLLDLYQTNNYSMDSFESPVITQDDNDKPDESHHAVVGMDTSPRFLRNINTSTPDVARMPTQPSNIHTESDSDDNSIIEQSSRPTKKHKKNYINTPTIQQTQQIYNEAFSQDEDDEDDDDNHKMPATITNTTPLERDQGLLFTENQTYHNVGENGSTQQESDLNNRGINTGNNMETNATNANEVMTETMQQQNIIDTPLLGVHQEEVPTEEQNNSRNNATINAAVVTQEDEEEAIPTVRNYLPFDSVPINKNLHGVPARLMADVDSISLLSSSLAKIIANLDVSKGKRLILRNSFDRLYCNVSSRYYIKPNENLELKYGKTTLATKPVKLSMLPNIRLFTIETTKLHYNISMYFLDAERFLGRNATCYLTDRSLLCIVMAFNIVKHQWESFPIVWQQFVHKQSDKYHIKQLMETIQVFYIQKHGATYSTSSLSIDLQSGMIILLMFEHALRRLASPDWQGDYKEAKFTGNFHSISDSHFHTNDVLIREQAAKLVKYMLFDMSSVGIKFEFQKLESFLPDLSDDEAVVKEHKVLCRMITNKFKYHINQNKEEKQNITIPNTNHELIAGFDVGLQLYPVIPGTNFVLNGQETKTLVNNYLARTTLDETLYESTSQLLKPPNIHTTEGDQWDSDDEDNHWDWKRHTCDYEEPTEYFYDAEYFSTEKADHWFEEDGTPKNYTFMDPNGNFQEGQEHAFQQCQNTRVVTIGDNVIPNYIPKSFTNDAYWQTLYPNTQSDEMVLAVPEPGDDNGEPIDLQAAQPNEVNNDPNEPPPVEQEEEEEEEQEEADEEPILQLIEVIVGGNERLLANPNERTQQNNGDANQITEQNDQPEQVEETEINLDMLSELREQTKRTRIFPQYLSKGRIANVHLEQIFIELVRSDPTNVESHLTVKLVANANHKTCDGANIYLPHTRSLFSKQSSKTQMLESLFMPHYLTNLLSNVITTPDIKEYRKLQRLVSAMNTNTDLLLSSLRNSDRQPIRQELTFATNDLWNRKFRWPSDQTLANTSHIGVTEARHMFLFTHKVCTESMIPLVHITRALELPNFTLISPQAKTCLLFMTERIMTIFQYFGYSGNIMRLFKRNYRNHPEASPPDCMVVSISQQDHSNTLLPYGLKTECLPIFAVNPVRLAPAFRRGVQNEAQIYVLDMAKKIQLTQDYLLYQKSILSILQQYSRNCETRGNSIVGPYMQNTEEMNLDETSAAAYRTGFFDTVNYKNLATMDAKSVENIFRDISTIVISGYQTFMLKRINYRFNIQPPLKRLPRNTTEFYIILQDQPQWARTLFTCITAPYKKKVTGMDKLPIIDDSK